MAASVKEQQQFPPQSKPDEEELEDGELDSDEEEQQQQPESAKSIYANPQAMLAATAAAASLNQRSSTGDQNRSSPTHDSESRHSKRRRTISSNKNDKSGKRNRISDEEEDDSSDEQKVDAKTMMQMFKQMQEMLKSASESKTHKQKEVNKIYERMKKSNFNQKEMAEMLKKTRKKIKSDSYRVGDDYGGPKGSPETTILCGNGGSFVSSWSDDPKVCFGKRTKSGKLIHDDMKELPKHQTPCKFYLEGHCNRGNDCAFMHQLQAPFHLKREVCKFYLQDSCSKGDNCAFMHKEFPCKFFHTGVECVAGENCRFSHEPMDEEMRQVFNAYVGNSDLNEELNQGYSFFGAGSSVSRPAILGDPPEDVKHSYRTWAWQQEMKKLEDAYSGTKRNLFCVPDQYVIKDQPECDEEFDEIFFDNSAEFGDPENHVLPEPSYYIDTLGTDSDLRTTTESNPRPTATVAQEDEEELLRLCANDLDLRTMNIQDLTNTPFGLEFDDPPPTTSTSTVIPENTEQVDIKSNPALKNWLGEDSDDDEEDQSSKKFGGESPAIESENSQSNSSLKANIDITKMLDAIRQSTAKTTQPDPPERHNDFWMNILNGVPINSNSQVASTPPTLNTSFTSATPSVEPAVVARDPRDPRLKRQRLPINSSVSQSTFIQDSSGSSPQQSALKNRRASYDTRIVTDEPYSLSEGDITFRLYTVDIDKIDYSKYSVQYHMDSRMKNDPRLQKFFVSNNNTSTQLPITSSFIISSDLSKSSNNFYNISDTKTNIITATTSTTNAANSSIFSSFSSLAGSGNLKTESTSTPPGLMSAAQLISSTKASLDAATNSSILNLDLDVNKDSIIPQGLSGLANLVTEKIKRNTLSPSSEPINETNNISSPSNTDTIASPPQDTFATASIFDGKDIIQDNQSNNNEEEVDDDDDDPDSPPPNRLTIMDEEPLEPSSPRLIIESDV